MSLRREDATPMYEILEQTPDIPDNCQWGLFLRNHDELTLEMVTDEERDYMYAEYAKDPRMKLNLGIRRRLAPLLDNGRDEIELMTAILFSLPGSPVLYYGDEIGMGDNVYLGDRDGVRTPMQWTGDRNGGFSRADFAQLYAPPLMDPVYGYQAVNVEAQLRTPTSLLRWLKRFIALRKEHPSSASAATSRCRPSNTKVFAHIRRYENDIALCVHNLARSAQAVELDLSAFEGRWPEEMFGRTRFPRIGELPYLLTLAPRGFFWFLLRADPEDEAAEAAEAAALEAAPMATTERRAHPMLPDLRALDEEQLAEWLSQRRWFGAKSRELAQVHVLDAIVLHDGPPPLALGDRRGALPRWHPRPLPAAAGLAAGQRGLGDERRAELGDATVYDALADPEAIAASVARCCASERPSATHRASRSTGSTTRVSRRPATPPARPIGAEQSNSSRRARRAARAEGVPADSRRARTRSSRCCAS